MGPRWIVAGVDRVEVLRGLIPDLNAMADLDRRTDTTGVTVYAIDDDRGTASVELRSFAPLHGIPEDPVCGSGNASVGAYLHATGGLARFPAGRYLARQGAAVGRAGEIQVNVDAVSVMTARRSASAARAIASSKRTIRLA